LEGADQLVAGEGVRLGKNKFPGGEKYD